MNKQEYLVEMTFAPFGSPLSPQEVIGFVESNALPTLEACEAHRLSGRIAAGGTFLGAGGLVFVARVDAASELEEMLTGLPLWSRAETRVVPLGSFVQRRDSARNRLARLKDRAAKREVSP